LPVAPTLIADETQGASTETLTEEQAKPRKRFLFHFGSELPDPTALSSPTRSPIVPASERIRGGHGQKFSSGFCGISISDV
jgi:hypothetical protein